VDEWWSTSEKPDVARIDLEDKLLGLWRYIMIEKRQPAHRQNKEPTSYLL